MNPETIMNLLVGVLAGWTVTVFQEPYKDIKNILLKNKHIPKVLVDILMPVIGLLILMGMVLLIFA